MAGLELDRWQQFVLVHSLGEVAGWKCPECNWRWDDGRCPVHSRATMFHPFAAFEVGLTVSRQNGKGGILEARELAGLFILGERLIIHSAHQFDTSIEAYRRLSALIRETPELKSRVKGFSNSHGSEGIELRSGQRIRFRTRTKGGGRGFTGDCLVLDEAMDIPESTHAALLPTLSARPNPQVWYTGSAVDREVDDNGVVFSRIRERGLAGDDPSLAYFEWSADMSIDDVSSVRTAEPEGWAQSNPALGIRITSEHVARERIALSTRKFAVERLGVGDWARTDDLTDKVIDMAIWADREDAQSVLEDPVCLAFDVPRDRTSCTIAAAGYRSDGEPHIEIVVQLAGTHWVVARLAKLKEAHRPASIRCDAYGPAGSLLSELEKVGIEVEPVTAKEYAQACGFFYDAVMDSKTLHHLGTPALNAAVDGATTRPHGDAWAWDRKSSSVDISPLVACTLALWASSHMRPLEPATAAAAPPQGRSDDFFRPTRRLVL